MVALLPIEVRGKIITTRYQYPLNFCGQAIGWNVSLKHYLAFGYNFQLTNDQ